MTNEEILALYEERHRQFTFNEDFKEWVIGLLILIARILLYKNRQDLDKEDKDAKYDSLLARFQEQEKFTAQAKEIIRQFLNDYPAITKELLDKLEQFLKQEDKDATKSIR